ncbi:MAG: DNA polymerase III subunit delta' [Candidatus Sungbacteria bacterium]|nr:DNA polymerase III subunit delta' [bacterium]MDZ4260098.1 DNA polymerase III subunit delta' [Candidatus Sungbacteria bacterium]
MSTPFIGHDRQISYINKIRSRGRMAHAYLFHGPEHLGKLTLALMLAQSFFCPQSTKTDIRSVCGTCASCQAIVNRRFPHVIFLDTHHTLVSKKETRKEIPIEDIRELKRIFSLRPAGETWRLAIIDEADKMSEEAVNAFLKLLEEPGPQTLIILIAPSRDLLLPTILSRTQVVGFFPVPELKLRAFMETKDITAKMQDELLVLAGGRPGILMRVCSDSAYAQQERGFADEIEHIIFDRDILNALRLSEKIAPDQALREKTVGWIISFLRRQLIAELGASSDKLVKKIKRIDRIAMLLETTNANPRLGMDVIFLESMAI